MPRHIDHSSHIINLATLHAQPQIDKRYNIVYVPYEGTMQERMLKQDRKKCKNSPTATYEMRKCTIDEY